MRRKLFLLLLIFTTIANSIVFYFRDRFHYQFYASYSDLYGRCTEECENKWKQFADDYSKNDLKDARRITDSISGKKIHTLDKLLAIADFLHNRFSKQSGKPSNELLQASPLNQYKMLCASASEKLWCGNFAQMFSFFCWSQNIVTRNIEIMYPADRHVLNECYIPEMGTWIMVDVTNKIFLTRNQEAKFLNLIQFKEALRKKEHLSVLKATDSSSSRQMTTLLRQNVPVQYSPGYPIYYYHRVNNQKVYSAGEKLKRYILPVSWYDIFDENKKHSNLAFYLKEILIFLWLVCLGIFLFSRTKYKT